MTPSDYGRSVIRTVVPLVLGSLVGWLATRGVRVDVTAVTTIVDATLGGLYYVVVRAIEQRWPKAGWLLGAPGAPSYASKAVSSVASAPVYQNTPGEIESVDGALSVDASVEHQSPAAGLPD